MPRQPSWEAELLADQVEEKRLKKMGVIEDLDVTGIGLDKLITKFVRDWRVKTRQLPDGSSKKQWVRRPRLVAREYAVEKRDDVYSPASASHALRLLPVLYLAMRSLGYDHDGETGKPVIGALDVKDAFLQVPQEISLDKGLERKHGMSTSGTTWWRTKASNLMW